MKKGHHKLKEKIFVKKVNVLRGNYESEEDSRLYRKFDSGDQESEGRGVVLEILYDFLILKSNEDSGGFN